MDVDEESELAESRSPSKHSKESKMSLEVSPVKESGVSYDEESKEEDEQEKKSKKEERDEDKWERDVYTFEEELEEEGQDDENVLITKIQTSIENHAFGYLTSDVEFLYESWKKSIDKQSELVAIIDNLKIEQNESMERFDALQSKFNEQESKIESLKEEIEASCKMVDAAHRREQLTQEALDGMRDQVVKLGSELESAKKLGGEQDAEAGTLAKNKEMLVKEKERLMAELLVAKGKLTKAQKYQREMEEKNEEWENRVNKLTTDLEALNMEHTQLKRLRANLNAELTAKTIEVDESTKAYADLMNSYHSEQIKKDQLEVVKFEQKIQIDKFIKENQDLKASLKSFQMEVQQHLANIARLNQVLGEKSAELKSKEDEYTRLEFEFAKGERVKESLLKKLTVFENQKATIEKNNSKLQNDFMTMEKEMCEIREQSGKDRKMIDSLNRDKELLARNAHKLSAFSQNQQNMINLQEISKKKLETELDEMQKKFSKLQKDYQLSLNEKESLHSQLLEYKNKVVDKNELIKVKHQELADSLKKIVDTESHLKSTINLFDQMRNERNKLSKSFIEAQDQIKNLQNELNVKTFEVEQLKEDVTAKENMLVKGDFVLQKVVKEKESLRLENLSIRSDFNENKDQLQAILQEKKQMQKEIERLEGEVAKLAKETNDLLNDKNYMASQLLSKSEEIKLLHEKMDILEDILHRGEAQYTQRMDDIRLLKLEVKRVRQEKSLMAKSVTNMVDLRKELFRLERDYTRERVRSRALEDELTKPLNVHRWRKLEGSDPSYYELMLKVRKLQKRVIEASEETAISQVRFEHINKLYTDLQGEYSRHDTTTMSSQLHLARAISKKKELKIKAMLGERSMYEHQISELKINIENKDKELEELKKKYYVLKKMKLNIKESEDSFLPLLESMAGGKKCVGGGFNLSPTSSQKLPALS